MGEDVFSTFDLLTWFPFAVAAFWSTYVLWVQIPRLLFELNGYAEPQGIMGISVSRPPPWKKFALGTAVAGLLVAPLVACALGAAISLVFLGLAAAKVWLSASI